MARISTLVFDAAEPVHVGRLTLTERAVLVAARAGLEPVRIWGAKPLDAAVLRRLHARGVFPIQLPSDSTPFGAIDGDEHVVLVGPNVLVERDALTDLAAETARPDVERAHLLCDARGPVLARLSPAAVAELRAWMSFDGIAATLAARGPVADRALAGRFYRRVDRPALIHAAERDFLRHTDGGAKESFFTKIIRRFSVPLAGRLVRLGATPTQVTLGGLALAAASAWCLAHGSYAAGVAGGVLYYVSMIFDCSDGEVARLTVRDSSFGAWLETMVDYATYFMVLAALMYTSLGRPGIDTEVAIVAFAASVLVGLALTYMRQRVAAADPGQFDESSAEVLKSSGPIQRFARWGRQFIKRSTMAHLILVLALVNGLRWLLYLWAFGATVALVVTLAVGPFVVRRVAVPPPRVRHVDASS